MGTNLRKGLYGAAKLQDFLRKFPQNFLVETNDGKQPTLVLLSPETDSEPMGGWPDEAKILENNQKFSKKGLKRPIADVSGANPTTNNSWNNWQDYVQNGKSHRFDQLSASAHRHAAMSSASGNMMGAQYTMQLAGMLHDQSS